MNTGEIILKDLLSRVEISMTDAAFIATSKEDGKMIPLSRIIEEAKRYDK